MSVRYRHVTPGPGSPLAPELAPVPVTNNSDIEEGYYRVWAPHVGLLELAIGTGRLPMTRDADGWWTACCQTRGGELYGFVVDGKGPFPDPRSMFQPCGVHGLSQKVDHGSFVWSDDGWQAPPLASAVIYELHIGTFSDPGTFAGAIARLPYLADLGVTHVQLMPVAEFSGRRGWGYDGVALFAPHHVYGSPDDLKRLVDACHSRGLAVILDVVYNHFGPAGNYLSTFAPYFTSRYHTPWGDAVNLDDADSHEVRRFLCDNALMWLREYHFDGLRLDAVHALIDTSACHLLEQLAAEVDTLEAVSGRHLVLVAESDLNDPRVIRPREAGGLGMDAQWSDDFHHAVHALVTGERAGYYEDFGTSAHISRAFDDAYVYDGAYSRHRRRRHGRPPHDVPGWRFVVAVQNHDQVGNRAAGDRLTHLVSVGRLKVAAALLLTSAFVPLLFQGEEWGASTPFQYFTAHEDEDLARCVSEGRRHEFSAFGWDPASIPDPQAMETFEQSRLRWDEVAETGHAHLLEWYRALIGLRREQPSLRDGAYRNVQVALDEELKQLTICRGTLVIACNLDRTRTTIAVPGVRRLLLASDAGVQLLDHSLCLPPDSVAVLEKAATSNHALSGGAS